MNEYTNKGSDRVCKPYLLAHVVPKSRGPTLSMNIVFMWSISYSRSRARTHLTSHKCFVD